MTVCNGCGKNYRGSGYMNHLKNARSPVCAAIYQRYISQLEAFPGIMEEEDLEEEMEEEGDSSTEVEESMFGGDFFGAGYASGDFPGFEDDDADGEEEDVEEYWSSSDSDDDEEDEIHNIRYVYAYIQRDNSKLI